VDPKLLYPLKHRGEDSQAHMAIIRSRQALVDCRTQLVNPGCEERSSPSVSSLAQVPGPKHPQQSGRAHPRGTPAGPGSHPGAEVGSLTQRIRDYDRQLEEISKESYPETDLLRQVEGIGPLTALTFVLTLEDPYRFQKSRSVGAYLGLVPARDQSGDRDPQRRISKEGDEMLSVGFWWAAPTTS
jgi:transposase